MTYLVITSDGLVHETEDVEVFVNILDAYGAEVESSVPSLAEFLLEQGTQERWEKILTESR